MRVILGLAAMVFLGACETQGAAYTLYRSSAASPSMRLHVATFDAGEGDAYNRENCQIAADLFAKRHGVTVRY